jgi:hypothetical protein
LEYKAGLDGALVRPDVPVFLPEAEDHPGLCHRPFPDEADSHRGVESLWDADRGVVRPACSDMVGAIPEVRPGHWGRLAVAVEKLAGRELRPADAVLGHPDPAWAACLARLASVGLGERLEEPRAVAEPCRPAEVLFAA